MRKRNHQIIVRLDDEELLMLKRKIHRSDLTMAEYFRLLIENGEIKMIDQDVQHDMRRKLQGIAVNINQMARPVAAHGIRDIAEAYLGVAQLLVLDAVQSDLDNMILRNAAFKQISLEYGEQQIGFSAAPYAGDDLDHAVVPALDQLVQICLSPDLHAITPIFCAMHVF